MWGKGLLKLKEQDYGIRQIILECGHLQNQYHLLLHGCIGTKDFGTPACSSGGYPLIKRGSISSYVLIAQDDLNTLGYRTGGLDGIFGAATQNAVRTYQSRVGLTADGIVGCNTWRALQEAVVGTGRTSTTIDQKIFTQSKMTLRNF